MNVTSASRWLFRIKAPFIARVATKAFTSMFTVRDGPYILSDSPYLVGKTTVRGVKRVELSEIWLITLVTITFLVNAVLFKFKKPDLTVRLNLKDFFSKWILFSHVVFTISYDNLLLVEYKNDIAYQYIHVPTCIISIYYPIFWYFATILTLGNTKNPMPGVTRDRIDPNVNTWPIYEEFKWCFKEFKFDWLPEPLIVMNLLWSFYDKYQARVTTCFIIRISE